MELAAEGGRRVPLEERAYSREALEAAIERADWEFVALWIAASVRRAVEAAKPEDAIDDLLGMLAGEPD